MTGINFLSPKNVVWIQTAFIGDIVLTTAAANALHNLRPEINQFITTPVGKAAIGESKLFKVISFNKRSGMKEILNVRKVKSLNFKE